MEKTFWACAMKTIPHRKKSSEIFLFITEGCDRVLVGRTTGGRNAEDQSNGGCDAKRKYNGSKTDDGRNSSNSRHDVGHRNSQNDAYHTATHTDHDCLEKKLLDHVRFLCTDREAKSDLLDPLQHRRQHDVHDPDATHEQ